MGDFRQRIKKPLCCQGQTVWGGAEGLGEGQSPPGSRWAESRGDPAGDRLRGMLCREMTALTMNHGHRQTEHVLRRQKPKKPNEKHDSIKIKRKIHSQELKSQVQYICIYTHCCTHHVLSVLFYPPSPREQIFKQITIHRHVCPKCQE